MKTTCPLCGAEFDQGESCRERFELCLALEFEHPGTFGAVHHLTVPAYYLQHNLYSREGWQQARQLLSLFVEQGLSPQQVHREQRALVSSSRRSYSFTRGDKLAEFERIAWKHSLAEVRLEDPTQYCQDIRTWAKSILTDTRFLSS